MSRWGKPTKNKRRIDPRYFLKEQEEQEGYSYDPMTFSSMMQNLPSPSDEGPSMYSGDSPRYSQRPAKVSNLNPWDATYEGSSDPSVPGALRDFAETAIEYGVDKGSKLNPITRRLGLATDLADTSVKASIGETGEAVRTGASAVADLAGGAAGGLFGATPWGLASGGPPVWAPVGAAAASYGYRSLPGHETADRMYDKHGFTGTLGQKLENKERSLVTEQQYKRFQKLAAINNSKQDKTMLTEEITTGFIIGMVIFALFGDEFQSRAKDQEPGIVTKLAKGAVSAWNSLKQKASSLTQQGDPSLESAVGKIESNANQAGPSLSDEQIAMIQQQFSDDQQLALMIEELAEIPPDQRQQAIAEIEQYIRTKLQ